MRIIKGIINFFKNLETLSQTEHREKQNAAAEVYNAKIDALHNLPTYKVTSTIKDPIKKAIDLLNKKSDLRTCIEQHICIQCGGQLIKCDVIYCDTCKINFAGFDHF